jgi:hypothetical protein
VNIPPFLTAAIGLITTVLSASAATNITSLPFIVPGPGTYELTAAAVTSFVPTTGEAAITVQSNTGTIVINLKNLTLDGGGVAQTGVLLQNSSNVSVKNGTIQNFASAGVEVAVNTAEIALSHLTFNNDGAGVFLVRATSPVVEECVFNGGSYGIDDVFSRGGERFVDCSFNGQTITPLNIGLLSSWLINNLHVALPSSTP